MKTQVCRSVATTKTILLLGSDLALHYELCTQNVNALLVQEGTLLLLWKAQEVRDLGMSPVRTQPRKARIAYRMPLEGNWQSWLTPGWELGTFCSEAGSWGDRAVTTAAPTAPLYRITDCRRLSQINPTYLNHWPRKPQQKIHSEDVLNMTCIPLYFEMWNEYPKLISIKH